MRLKFDTELRMINRVTDFLKKYALQDKTIIVGFSGGYDSMCLLDILSKIKQSPEFMNMNVIAAHFNHNWRGEESYKEQEVCKLFAAAKGFEFVTKTAPKTLKKTENDARIARYEFFDEVYDEYDADAVLTAHNRDDNAETVLYRVIKGTGIIGLKGIAEKRAYFYRPLLSTYRTEIMQYCNKNNLCPNDDSSNSNTNYKRNYLRLNVLPSLEKINPEVKEALNTLAQNAASDNEIIEEYISAIRPKVFNEETIRSQEYRKLSKPVKSRFLYEFIQTLNIDPDSKRIREIFDFIEQNITQKNGSTMSLATALWLYADEKIIETIPRKKTEDLTSLLVSIDGEGEYQIGNRIFVVKVFDRAEDFLFPISTANSAFVDLSGVEFPLEIRTRRDGDIITPFGMDGSMKLKKYFNSRGVSRHIRDNVPLLCKDGEVLWAMGVGLSSKIGVTERPTHILEIK